MPLPRLHPFRPRSLALLGGHPRERLIADIGAGLTVGIVALPLALAFAIASGLRPEQGLATAIVAGLLISLLGGSNVQIGGPAGAFIVVVYGILQRHGLAGLLLSTMGAGVLLFAMGALRLGGLVRYVPVAIVTGFTNGIAVLIALAQLKDFLGLRIAAMPADFFGQIGALYAHAATLNPGAPALALACMAVVLLWPKNIDRERPLTGTRRWLALLPGTVVALGGATVVTALLNLPLETIGSRFGAIPRTLPALAWPELSWAAAQQLVIPTVTLALLGAIESLLCARVADKLTPDLPRHDPNQELMAQGLANLAAPLFGGLPATGTIARTVTNIRAGGSSPVAGIVHALTLLLILLAAAPLAVHVPLAALAGILLVVAWNMGEWHEFARLRRFHATYRALLLGTFVLTVMADLTVAVEVGLISACVFFVWRMGQLFTLKPVLDQPLPEGVVAYELYGALFFGAVGKLEPLPEQLPAGTRALVLEMHRLVIIDSSGAEALRELHRALLKRGTALVLAHVNAQPLDLLHRSGLAGELGDAAIVPGIADLKSPP
ncbi:MULTISPECIES: SulP family inorganic anion transporter [unclassified Roseateles]|uniref:SulP family inorganic anion transporter n=1 Tax=unclassified Roseateles TaxID=2626991 RepID=UPI0006F96AF6|nr:MULTISPECIES: SulP family inorganic anion transporter [unclassified Roseateles]KQW51922.1 sulfate transporter [Pelomonas sp. Root405]KRA78155.1 sulfate transporter [Pelomonas sp. Root662]